MIHASPTLLKIIHVFFKFQIKDLEYRLNKIRKRETECREELNEAVRVHEFEKLKFQQRVLELENENTELKSRLEEVESGSEDLMRDLQTEVKQLREENERYRLSIEENEEMKVSLEARLIVALEDAKDVEQLKQDFQLAQLKIKAMKMLVIFKFLRLNFNVCAFFFRIWKVKKKN